MHEYLYITLQIIYLLGVAFFTYAANLGEKMFPTKHPRVVHELLLGLFVLCWPLTSVPCILFNWRQYRGK